MPIAIRHCSRCAAALLVVLAPFAGQAQTSPYYLGVSQTLGYDSNIFRVPDRTEVALPDGSVRGGFAAVADWLSRSTPEDLVHTQREAENFFRGIGITSNV